MKACAMTLHKLVSSLTGPSSVLYKLQHLNPDTFQPKEHSPAWSFEKQASLNHFQVTTNKKQKVTKWYGTNPMHIDSHEFYKSCTKNTVDTSNPAPPRM